MIKIQKKKLKKIKRGLVGGSILSGIWIIIFYIAVQDSYYGLAILPAIFISIILFIIGAVIGVVTGEKKAGRR